MGTANSYVNSGYCVLENSNMDPQDFIVRDAGNEISYASGTYTYTPAQGNGWNTYIGDPLPNHNNDYVYIQPQQPWAQPPYDQGWDNVTEALRNIQDGQDREGLERELQRLRDEVAELKKMIQQFKKGIFIIDEGV